MNRFSALTILATGIAANQVGDSCPTSGSVSVVNECTSDCYDSCVIKSIAYTDEASNNSTTGVDNYLCGCQDEDAAPIPITPVPAPAPEAASDSTCEPAYDNADYCKCPEPKEYEADSEKMEVSVCGDATYLLESGVIPCSGPVSEDAKGTGCPKKGDTTDIACREEIMSYLTGGKTGTCKAPEDATCEKLNTGAWGCVFPGNCNTVNTCMEELVCTDEYEKDANGTCIVMDNGYVKPAENNTALYDTTALSELQQKISESSASAIVVSVSTIFSGFAILALF